MTKRKITKPASEAQIRARERNWNKGKINCIINIAERLHKSETTSNIEKMNLEIIMTRAKIILRDWDK